MILAIPDGRGTKTIRTWLTEEDTSLVMPGPTGPTWVMPNAGASGYYVWNVPGVWLEAIAKDHARLTPAERIGYIRNLILLQRAGVVPAEDYLRLLQNFRDDAEPEVALALVAALEAIREPLVTPEVEGLFADQVRQILQPSVTRMGLAPKTGEMPAVAAARPKVLKAIGDLGMDREVRRWADELTARTLSGAAVDPGLQEAALPLAAMRGDAKLMAELEKRFAATKVPSERAQYLTALGNFRDPAIAKQLLDWTLTGPLRPQEVITLPTTLAEWPEQRDLVYRWMKGRYPDLVKRIPSHMFVRMMPIVRGCSESRMADAKKYFADSAHTFPGASFVMARTEDAVEDCARNADKNRARFADWLKSVASRP